MEQNNKIFACMANANKAITAISKSQRNQQQGFMYRSIDDIYNDLHKILADNDIFIIPEVVDFTVDEKVTPKGTILYYTRASIKHHFTASDGSEVCSVTVGEAMDAGDKGMNKAMSISLKYALMQIFTIPTCEQKDPDSTTPEETVQSEEDFDPLSCADWLRESNTKAELSSRYKRLTKQQQQNRVIIDCLAELKERFSK